MATIHPVQAPSGWAHPAAHPDDSRGGFGEWLAQARKARGLTLNDISRETKIPLRNLQALEHGNLGFVPAFYERAEVRAVARAVGIDERLAVGRLDTATAPAVESPKERHEHVARSWLKSSGALASVALAFGVMLVAAGIGRAVFLWSASSQPPGNSVAAAALTAAPPCGIAAVVPVGRPEPVALQESVATAKPVALATAVAIVEPVAITKAVAIAEPVAIPEPVVPQTDGGQPPATLNDTSTAASTASFTEIVVKTDPPGARVTVNGISWGVSPVTIRNLPPGAKRIRATKDGFAATEQVLALDDGQRQALNLHLPGAD